MINEPTLPHLAGAMVIYGGIFGILFGVALGDFPDYSIAAEGILQPD